MYTTGLAGYSCLIWFRTQAGASPFSGLQSVALYYTALHYTGLAGLPVSQVHFSIVACSARLVEHTERERSIYCGSAPVHWGTRDQLGYAAGGTPTYVAGRDRNSTVETRAVSRAFAHLVQGS